jgi:hypothetical protein
MLQINAIQLVNIFSDILAPEELLPYLKRPAVDGFKPINFSASEALSPSYAFY